MLSFFSKDEDLTKSPPVVGAKILNLFDETKKEKISIFDLAKELNKNNSLGVRAIYFGMVFLYTLDLIDFDEPYVINKNVKNK